MNNTIIIRTLLSALMELAKIMLFWIGIICPIAFIANGPEITTGIPTVLIVGAIALICWGILSCIKE